MRKMLCLGLSLAETGNVKFNIKLLDKNSKSDEYRLCAHGS